MDYERLGIDVELQDELMQTFGFTHPVKAFEVGILLLSTFAKAKKDGCDMMYLHKIDNGVDVYYKFDYLGLVEYLKSEPNGTTHGVKINKNKHEEEKSSNEQQSNV